MKRIISFILTAALLMFTPSCATFETYSPDVPENPQFAAHFIDVGQADAALIECDGANMMIDGGNAEDSSLVASYLKRRAISHIDCVVCTHAHEDHVGGLSGVLSVADVDRVIAPKTPSDTKAYKNFVRKTEENGLKIETPAADDSFILGNALVEILGPLSEDTDELNNTSIVLKITYGSVSFLFTGDAEREEEESILESGADLKSTVLKVGHHGSGTSTSYPFLREVMPEISVISVGKDNYYDHPHENIVSRLKDAGSEVYRTDLNGDIVITSDGTNVSVSAEK